MKEIQIGINDSEQRVDKFLFKLFGDLAGGMVYKWIRKKRIKINGKKTENSYKLKEGDVVSLYVNDEFFPESFKENADNSVQKETKAVDKTAAIKKLNQNGIKIVYEDDNIMLIDKKSGINSHGGDNSALSEVINYLNEVGAYNSGDSLTFSPSLCNRIDRNTAGIVIIAKNAAALREMNERIKNREIRKFYLLKAEGNIALKEGFIEGYLVNDEKNNITRYYKEPKKYSKYSRTNFRVLKRENGYSIAEAELVTGRKHQIRVHFASIGHPLCGDVKYGAKRNGKNDYQNLAAYKLTFDFKSDGILSYLKGKTFTAGYEKNF